MTMPTVGRIMWFYPGFDTKHMERLDKKQPFKADVCFVHNENVVNVLVTDHLGFTYRMGDIPILQEGSPYKMDDGSTIRGYLMWMPFQIQKHKEDETKQAKANP